MNHCDSCEALAEEIKTLKQDLLLLEKQLQDNCEHDFTGEPYCLYCGIFKATFIQPMDNLD